ncbi:MAG: hypothetical protein JWM09_517, partial [Francisellaceae bacterium]|nr:hypothetical protein [Francisellaceae bacterium]
MNKKHRARCLWISLYLIGLLLACGLILYALKQNINLF